MAEDPWWRRTRPGALTVSPFGGRLRCHLCPGAFHQLALHVRLRHGVSAQQYRAAFELGDRVVLASTSLRLRLRRLARARLARS